MPAHSTASPDFSDFYSFERAGAHLDHERQFNDTSTRMPDGVSSTPEYIATLRSHGKERQTAIGNFLTSLRDAGRLSEVPFSARRGHRWAAPWNRFVAGNEQAWDLDIVVGPIANALDTKIFCSLAPRAVTVPDNAHLYGELVRMMNTGDFDPLVLGDDARAPCGATGKRLHVQITPGWKPLLGELTFQPRTFTAVTDDCPAPAVISHAIPAPSGELLIADWFRLSNNLFSDIVDPKSHQFELCYPFGRAQQTAHYAREFGFMSVEAGNSCPGILERRDHFLIGEIDYGARSAPSGVLKGSVCTDLWWVSMIDRQVLVDLLAGKLGPEAAQAAVDDYVASAVASSSISVLRVAPGTVHFHFTADRRDLAGFQCAGPIETDFQSVEPILVVSSAPLHWTPRESVSEDSQLASQRHCQRA